jgi:hypothetical protein
MSTNGNHSDAAYTGFLQRVSATFHARVTQNSLKIFVTDAADLWETYMDSFGPEGTEAKPNEVRQHHNCNACRHFIQRYGALAVIADDGSLIPAVWNPDDAPDLYRPALEALATKVRRAKVTAQFLSSEPVLGTPETGGWQHLYVKQPLGAVYKDRVKTAGQAAAEALQDYYTLISALNLISVESIEKGLVLLRAGQLYRGDKYVPAAEWLLGVAKLRAEGGWKNYHRVWLSVAKAPAGFAKPRGTAMGSLLENLQAGMAFPELKAKFEAMLAPETYQRAQVAPTAGAREQAEKLVEQMGLAPALPRRYAKLSEISTIWAPSVLAHKASQPGQSVFGHLAVKGQEPGPLTAVPGLPPTTMTWDKFLRQVLPGALRIEAKVPEANRFAALVTAEDAAAPPLLRWDHEGARNPVSWFYDSGADAEVRQRVTRAGGMYENTDVRVSLIWNNTDDLDLHVMTPHGDHICFMQKRACRHGGFLDVDMNVSGETTSPVENTRWAAGRAPFGTFDVVVNNYRNRGFGRMRTTPFMVEVQVGSELRQFHGEIRGEGQYSASPNGVAVVRFNRQPGGGVSWGAPGVSPAASSQASQWGLALGVFAKVHSIAKSPNLWGAAPVPASGNHTFFLLEGCRPVDAGKGRGFFPEMLRSELHPVRSVLEAYAGQSSLGGEPEACGLGMTDQQPWNLHLRVATAAGVQDYLIDRAD